jgi:hypothetical protein
LASFPNTKKGATVPQGNTEFQFKAGDINFKSVNYQWLIVQGKDKASFKGTGTINGQGNYGFMLTVYDGGKTTNPDMFRIKIWDIASSAIVYDNNVASTFADIDNLPATTPIAGGSIVVH